MITEILIASVATASLLTYFAWHKGIHDLMLKLSDSAHDDEDDPGELTVSEVKTRTLELPEVVQKYIVKSVCREAADCDDDIVPYARSMRMEQEGEFLVNGEFTPFTASQEFSTRFEHAGFVWDAAIQNGTCLPSINVCDAYINGGGIMRATTMGVPVMRVKSNSPEVNLGELTRWAAEATLFPLALLPHTSAKTNSEGRKEEASLKWLAPQEGDSSSAILELTLHGTTARMKYCFDPDTHLVTSIQMKRPRAVGSKYELTHWEAFCHDYEVHGGLLVPTRMEAGWKLKENEPLEIYFKGSNHNLIYLLKNHPMHLCNKKHEHVHVE